MLPKEGKRRTENLGQYVAGSQLSWAALGQTIAFQAVSDFAHFTSGNRCERKRKGHGLGSCVRGVSSPTQVMTPRSAVHDSCPI
jgi:hypothetical protein